MVAENGHPSVSLLHKADLESRGRGKLKHKKIITNLTFRTCKYCQNFLKKKSNLINILKRIKLLFLSQKKLQTKILKI